MNIPVFHDDQHGTAIVVGAAATNALYVAGKRFEDIKVVSTAVARRASPASTCC
jgi:malate dehydrogenase (oxaloacetate-decarboxylating)(NADP+)